MAASVESRKRVSSFFHLSMMHDVTKARRKEEDKKDQKTIIIFLSSKQPNSQRKNLMCVCCHIFLAHATHHIVIEIHLSSIRGARTCKRTRMTSSEKLEREWQKKSFEISPEKKRKPPHIISERTTIFRLHQHKQILCKLSFLFCRRGDESECLKNVCIYGIHLCMEWWWRLWQVWWPHFHLTQHKETQNSQW